MIKLEITCDRCKEVSLKVEGQDLAPMIKQMIKLVKGWDTGTVKGKILNLCPKCKE